MDLRGQILKRLCRGLLVHRSQQGAHQVRLQRRTPVCEADLLDKVFGCRLRIQFGFDQTFGRVEAVCDAILVGLRAALAEHGAIGSQGFVIPSRLEQSATQQQPCFAALR